MSHTHSESEKLNARMRRGTKYLFIWTFAWVASCALIAFGPKFLWDFNIAITLIALATNLLLGIKMVLTFKQHLEDMDELQRKIHFNAMAISLGCTMILGNLLGYLEPSGLIDSAPNPSNVLFIMGISYMLAVFVNYRRYL